MTAGLSLCSPRVSNCFSTINNSRTTPSTASNARQSERVAEGFVPKPERRVPPVARRLRFLLSRPRADQFSAVRVSRSSSPLRRHRQRPPAPCRVERLAEQEKPACSRNPALCPLEPQSGCSEICVRVESLIPVHRWDFFSARCPMSRR